MIKRSDLMRCFARKNKVMDIKEFLQSLYLKYGTIKDIALIKNRILYKVNTVYILLYLCKKAFSVFIEVNMKASTTSALSFKIHEQSKTIKKMFRENKDENVSPKALSDYLFIFFQECRTA